MRENINAEIGDELKRIAAFTEDHLYAVSQRSRVSFQALTFELGGLLYALAGRRSLGDSEPASLSGVREFTAQGAIRVSAPTVGARMRGDAPHPPGYWKAVISVILNRQPPVELDRLRVLLQKQENLTYKQTGDIVASALKCKDAYLYRDKDKVSLASNVDVVRLQSYLENLHLRSSVLPPRAARSMSDAARHKMSIAKKAWWAAKKKNVA